MTPGKRLFDVFGAAAGLLALWPLFMIVALLIKRDDGGSVFFRQERVGRGGKLFRIWKFRTMVVDAEQRGKPLTIGRDPRLTSIGYSLRKFKIDELPQLVNVLAGEMSLVGPRPEVPRYVDQYTPAQREVLLMIPGITDPASIKFSHESELLATAQDPEALYVTEIMPEKIRLNLEYRDRANIIQDFLIILRTAQILFRG